MHFLTIFLFMGIFEASVSQDALAPEQIHISYGAIPSQMIITWITLDYVNESFVEFGVNELSYRSEGYVKKFVNNWIGTQRVTFVHQTMLTGLVPDQTYSKQFYLFCTPAENNKFFKKIIIINK